MKNTNPSSKHENEHSHQELEIHKAVAQAWHAHSSSSRTTNECDAYRRNFKAKPSRFKLEAINKLSSSSSSSKRVAANCRRNWDFNQSLLDSYEIVSMARRLERGLVFDDNPFPGLDNYRPVVLTRPKESKNSLRNLINRLSSRRFNYAGPPEDSNSSHWSLH